MTEGSRVWRTLPSASPGKPPPSLLASPSPDWDTEAFLRTVPPWSLTQGRKLLGFTPCDHRTEGIPWNYYQLLLSCLLHDAAQGHQVGCSICRGVPGQFQALPCISPRGRPWQQGITPLKDAACSPARQAWTDRAVWFGWVLSRDTQSLLLDPPATQL